MIKNDPNSELPTTQGRNHLFTTLSCIAVTAEWHIFTLLKLVVNGWYPDWLYGCIYFPLEELTAQFGLLFTNLWQGWKEIGNLSNTLNAHEDIFNPKSKRLLYWKMKSCPAISPCGDKWDISIKKLHCMKLLRMDL